MCIAFDVYSVSVVSEKLQLCLTEGSKVLYSSSSLNYEFFCVFTLARTYFLIVKMNYLKYMLMVIGIYKYIQQYSVPPNFSV